MTRAAYESAIARVKANADPDARDIEMLLSTADADEQALLFHEAARARDEACGRRMAVRGLVEFSSYCGNSCFYCGLNRANAAAERYRLSPREMLACAGRVAGAGIRTVVLQSGEDGTPAEELAGVVRAIKERHDMAVTLSVGERPRRDYALWKEAGADRYLLRVESVDAGLYASMHADRQVASRLRCLDDLRDLGYQVGSGIMVGPPGQTPAHIAADLRFFAARGFDMLGIGAFIAHPRTPFRDAPPGDVALALRVIAVARLLSPRAWMPATTALGSMDRDYRVDALRAGANVVMPNFTPEPCKAKYAIYPGKLCLKERAAGCRDEMARLAREAGLETDWSRADALTADTPRPVAVRT